MAPLTSSVTIISRGHTKSRYQVRPKFLIENILVRVASAAHSSQDFKKKEKKYFSALFITKLDKNYILFWAHRDAYDQKRAKTPVGLQQSRENFLERDGKGRGGEKGKIRRNWRDGQRKKWKVCLKVPTYRMTHCF